MSILIIIIIYACLYYSTCKLLPSLQPSLLVSGTLPSQIFLIGPFRTGTRDEFCIYSGDISSCMWAALYVDKHINSDNHHEYFAHLSFVVFFFMNASMGSPTLSLPFTNRSESSSSRERASGFVIS